MRRIVLICFGSAALASETHAQRTVSGHIVDVSGTPIPYAMIESATRRAIADDSGRFRIPVSQGSGFIRVRRIGFKPLNASYLAGGDTSMTVQLDHLARTLETAVIEATAVARGLELRGFYRRIRERDQGINAGQFVTAEEIHQRSPTRITQMLDGRPGIKTAMIGRGCAARSSQLCWAPQGTNGCWMTVYLDGRRMNSMVTGSNTPAVVDEFVIPSHIAGIEIYTSPLRAPPEYQSLNGTCGVVLLWSR